MSNEHINDNYGRDSPIAAFATLPGKSALTLNRCSGKGSIELAANVFSAPKKLLEATGNTVIHGWIVGDGEKIDEVLITVFRAPKSYTGEDSLDICCHGGFTAGRAVLETLKGGGFKDALPGEFTFRAFMNGKLDLTRCESVMELVSAKTDTGRRHAINRLSGVLEREINEIKSSLVEVLAGAEIFLDYSEDEIGADPDEAAGRLPKRKLATEACARLKKLAESWQTERIYQEGVFAVIAGRPNAGKSSLFNLLLKEERSIVTDIPGTTRDWIEAWISVEGIPVRLADTAGLRETRDHIEKIGVERSRELLDEADLVLYLIDGEEGVTGEDREFIKLEIRNEKLGIRTPDEAQRQAVSFNKYQHGESPGNSLCHDKGGLALARPAGDDRNLLLIWNKVDVAPLSEATVEGFEIVGVSAKTGEGLGELTRAIAAAVGGAAGSGGDAVAVGVGTVRQKNLVVAAAGALEEALHLADEDAPLDLIAPLLREAVNSLGEITGEVSTADILEEMFSRFCVGK